MSLKYVSDFAITQALAQAKAKLADSRHGTEVSFGVAGA